MKTTKENILRECFKLFLAKGYDATSIPDIEYATKNTYGAIFHHYLTYNFGTERIEKVSLASSFYEKMNEGITNRGNALIKEKWFTNLTSAERIGLATIDVALDEFV